MNEPAGRRRFPRVSYALALSAVVLIAFAPALLSFGAFVVASAAGCGVVLGEKLHSVPCLIMGQDWGLGLAYAAGAIWGLSVTIPAGAVALLIWLIALTVHLVTHFDLHRSQP